MATVSAFVLYDKISSFLVVPCRPRLSISMLLNMLVVIMSIKAMVLVLFTFRLLALGSCSPKMVDLLRSSPIKPYLWFRSSALLLNIDLGGFLVVLPNCYYISILLISSSILLRNCNNCYCFWSFLTKRDQPFPSHMYLWENLAPQHQILVMIFGLKIVSREALNWASKSYFP